LEKSNRGSGGRTSGLTLTECFCYNARMSRSSPFDLSRMETHHVLLMVVGIAGLVVLAWNLEHHLAAIEAWLAGMGHWAGLGFILLFVVLTPMLVSVDLLCIIAGAVFSLPQAIGYVMVATLVAAALIFFIGRRLAKDQVQRLLRRYPKLLGYQRIIGTDGVQVMFLLRLLPLPFAPMGYLFSVPRVRFLPYLAATTGIFVYNSAIIYFGYAARHLSRLSAQDGAAPAGHNMPMIAGIVGSIVIVYLISRVARARIETLSAAES
jgi:uncharacterized membrane protein YdjX (TVP38/TMEM64 family)